jgi:hypothetical protein
MTAATTTYINGAGTLKHLIVPIYNDPSQAGMYGDSITELVRIISTYWPEASYGNLQTPTTAAPPILIPGVGGGSSGPYDQRTRDALAAVGFPTDLFAIPFSILPDRLRPLRLHHAGGSHQWSRFQQRGLVVDQLRRRGHATVCNRSRNRALHRHRPYRGTARTGITVSVDWQYHGITLTTGDFWSVMGYQHYLTHPTSFQKARLGLAAADSAPGGR